MKLQSIEHGIETAAKNVVHAVVYPVTFISKAEHVVADAIAHQADLRAAVQELIAKASVVVGDTGKASLERGVNLTDDAKTLADAEAFFGYFNATFVPLVEKLYADIKSSVNAPATPDAVDANQATAAV